MIIKHIYDYSHGGCKPVATVVALSSDKAGVAVCNEKDQFNKRLGVKIATGRAQKELSPPKFIGRRDKYITLFDAQLDKFVEVPLVHAIQEVLDKMKTKAKEIS